MSRMFLYFYQYFSRGAGIFRNSPLQFGRKSRILKEGLNDFVGRKRSGL